MGTSRGSDQQLATSNWQLALAIGNWQLAIGNWQLATSNWQLAATSNLRFAFCYWLLALAFRSWLFTLLLAFGFCSRLSAFRCVLLALGTRRPSRLAATASQRRK